MSYLSKSLSDGEVVKYVAVKHWIIFVPHIVIFLFGFAAPPFFILGVIGVIWSILVRWTTELAITNKKVVGKWGVISRHTVEQRLEKVDSIQVNQGILGRILNFGTVRVNGTGLTSTPIPRISVPLAFRRSVELAVDEVRTKRVAA
jgi:uncharacterized membrane protein YdbT with pleckstrin-like domain